MRITAIMRLCILLAIIAGGAAVGQDSRSPTPLTAEQLVNVRQVLSRTRAEQIESRKKLAATQDQLAACYTEFELDDQKISELQAEAVATQKKLMDSHHAMHQQLRLILGIERFKSLALRIEAFLSDDSRNAEQKAKNGKPSEAKDSNAQSSTESNPSHVPPLGRGNSPSESAGK